MSGQILELFFEIRGYRVPESVDDRQLGEPGVLLDWRQG